MEEKFVEKEIDGVKNTNIEKLAKLFPSVVKDGQVDFEELKNELGDFEEVSDEKYEFSWVGKQMAKQEAQKGISGMTLKYCPEESKDADTTENLYIEGDNLKVLKLLRNNYANKIKMIYIDPPYNTGTDSFIYPDNYKTNSKKMEEQLGISSDGEKNINTNKDNWYKNTKDSSMYHSAWLSMMYSRLKISWEILTEDGVIFISIDDNEITNLRRICDEIFGERNFLAIIAREVIKGGSKSNNIRQVHDYIVCYAKDIETIEFSGIEMDGITLDKEDEHGKYAKGRELNKWGAGSRREDSPTMYYPIPGPNGEDVYPIRNDGSEGRWRLGKKKMFELLKADNAIFEPRGDGTYIVYQKVRDNSNRIKQFTTYFKDNYLNSKGSDELKKIFNTERAIFDFSKPTQLIKDLLLMNNSSDCIVLDFFSGSSTTADAIMQLNSEDNGKRKFIMVQVPEECEEKSEAYKAGYKNICEIGKERIRRAGDKIKAETGVDIDYGFKVFKLDETNINWEKQEFKDKVDDYLLFRTDEEKEELLKDFVDGAKDIDIVYELMLRYYGMPLSAKITKLDNIGSRTYSISDVIIVCLEDEITNEIVDKLSNIDFAKLYLRDSSFRGENSLEIKENLMIRLNLQKGYKDEKSYRIEFI